MHCKVAISAALVAVLAQVSTATTCTSQNATPVEQYINSGSGGGSGGAGRGAGALVSYDIFNIVSQAVKKRATPDAKLANVVYALSRRGPNDAVECSATEMCMSVEKAPFCLDYVTGAFHDGTGTKGNAVSGDYTLADGRKGNLFNGPYPLPSGMSAGAATATPAGGAGGANGVASKTTAAPGTGTAANTSPATPTSSSGTGHGRAQGGAAMGGVLAIVGAVLL
ncbi:hypothetical protein B0H63DRAFT_523052 [Podospora didyma]|uniref:Uncharacterized protein n=1 Tax=Podospora didyma TaxID=330526 RepID=A0AAE0U058_9PEZI|nr:hypothetical protein B0H63DRAFT_523052 [Podospora didyma]